MRFSACHPVDTFLKEPFYLSASLLRTIGYYDTELVGVSVLMLIKSIILVEDASYLMKSAAYQTLQYLHPVIPFGTFPWKVNIIKKILKRCNNI